MKIRYQSDPFNIAPVVDHQQHDAATLLCRKISKRYRLSSHHAGVIVELAALGEKSK